MRWIVMLLTVMLAASGCTLIEENNTLRSKNERLRRQATAAEMRADRLEREMEYARKHPEALRAQAARPPAAVAAKPAAAPPRVAGSGGAKKGIALGEGDVAAEAQAAAAGEVRLLNALIAGVKAEYDALGPDSDKYATGYNSLRDSIEKSRSSVALFDTVVAPALDPLPAPPSEAAQARYDALRAQEARRAEEARLAEEAAAQKRADEKEKAEFLKALRQSAPAEPAKPAATPAPPTDGVARPASITPPPASTPVPAAGGGGSKMK